MEFEFATASRIIFGEGKIRQVGDIARELGHVALLVTGVPAAVCGPIEEALTKAQVPFTTLAVRGEPTVQDVQQGVELARQQGCDLLIGFGGGSAIDTAKAVSAMLANPGDLYDYLEVVGRGQPLKNPSRPCIAIPTTAGTGAEVTRNAVLGSPQHRVKVSLRHPGMLPRLALVDPELTYDLPPAVTASTGLDALTQLIEPFVCNSPNPLTDALCREGILRASRSLRRAYESGRDAQARQDMALASLFGGLALANARLGAVHGFAGVLGGMFSAPHGAICARLLPAVMEVNVRLLRQRHSESGSRARYDEVSRWLTGDPSATSAEGVRWVQELCSALNIPLLAGYGLRREDFPQVIEKASRASSMKGNPLKLTPDEMAEILELSL